MRHTLFRHVHFSGNIVGEGHGIILSCEAGLLTLWNNETLAGSFTAALGQRSCLRIGRLDPPIHNIEKLACHPSLCASNSGATLLRHCIRLRRLIYSATVRVAETPLKPPLHCQRTGESQHQSVLPGDPRRLLLGPPPRLLVHRLLKAHSVQTSGSTG